MEKFLNSNVLICLGHILLYNWLIIQPNKENTQEMKPSKSKGHSMPISVSGRWHCIWERGPAEWLQIPPFPSHNNIAFIGNKREVKETISPNISFAINLNGQA